MVSVIGDSTFGWANKLGGPSFEATLLRRYPPQETRKTQFQVEEAFADLLKAQAVALSLPPNPSPDQPRYSIQGQKARLLVSDNAARLMLPFESRPSSGLRQPLTKAAIAMDKLDAIFNDQARYFNAISITAALKVPDRTSLIEIVGSLHSKLSVFKGVNPSTFNFAVVDSSLDIERIIDLSQFSSATFEAKPGETISFDWDFITPAEQGVQFKLEVNTRPASSEPVIGDMARLMPALNELALSDFGKSLGFDFEDYL